MTSLQNQGKNRILKKNVAIAALVCSLIVASFFAVYYYSLFSGSGTYPVTSLTTYKHSILILNNSVAILDGTGINALANKPVNASNEAITFAGSFSALKPGYLVVSGKTAPVAYYQDFIALYINMNNTKPTDYLQIGSNNAKEFPEWGGCCGPNSINQTFIQSPFTSRVFVLFPLIRGNVSIYVGTTNDTMSYAYLNATYYY
jgi:hypothetical protein